MIRIGQGFDVHQLVAGRPCIIGGVTIDFPLGLQGHSDADVLIHAISDALLGAAGLGDIGHYFPDSKKEFKDMNSRDILRFVVGLIRENGYVVNNIDATVICEQPKIYPYLKEMTENITYCQYLRIDAPLHKDYIATDGFHPSSKTYTLWAKEAAMAINEALELH